MELGNQKNLVHEADFDAAGNAIASSHPDAVDAVFGYTGRSWDEDVDLQYNRARWYSPTLGRWLSQDPISFAAGDANLYRYVGNAPVDATDPSGLEENEDLRARLEALLKKLRQQEHTANASLSNRERHQKGQSRKASDGRRKIDRELKAEAERAKKKAALEASKSEKQRCQEALNEIEDIFFWFSGSQAPPGNSMPCRLCLHIARQRLTASLRDA